MMRSKTVDPTPEEIRRMTAKIREEWDDDQLQRRAGGDPEPYAIPSVRCGPSSYSSRGDDVRAFL